MLTVDTPAVETNLVELDTVKAELCISGKDEDPRLERLISVASEAIAKFLQYPPWRQTYTETLPGSGMTELVLARAPIVSVSQVLINSIAVTDYEVDDAEAAILYREAGWPWGAQSSAHALSPHPVRQTARENNVAATYDAGWLLPGEGGRTLPASIEEMALLTVKAWYVDQKGTKTGSQQLVSKRMGDTTLRYADLSVVDQEAIMSALPPRAVTVLRPYRFLVEA